MQFLTWKGQRMNEATLRVLPVVALCTLHLAAGFVVGLLVAHTFRQRGPRVQRIARLERSLRFYREGMTRLAQQATQASLLSGARPELLIEAARALAKATRELQERGEHSRDHRRSAPRPSVLAPDEAHAMTRGEFHNLLKATSPNDGEFVADEAEAEGERHAYSVLQWMGRCCGDRLPPPEDFEEVMCHDLSPKGISFYAD